MRMVGVRDVAYLQCMHQLHIVDYVYVVGAVHAVGVCVRHDIFPMAYVISEIRGNLCAILQHTIRFQ